MSGGGVTTEDLFPVDEAMPRAWWVEHWSEGSLVAVGPFRSATRAHLFREAAFADPEYGDITDVPCTSKVMGVHEYQLAFRCDLRADVAVPADGWHGGFEK